MCDNPAIIVKDAVYVMEKIIFDVLICDIINIERLNIGLYYLPQPKSTSIDPQSAPEYHSTYVI